MRKFIVIAVLLLTQVKAEAAGPVRNAVKEVRQRIADRLDKRAHPVRDFVAERRPGILIPKLAASRAETQPQPRFNPPPALTAVMQAVAGAANCVGGVCKLPR